jgi:hypothetical protein
MTVSTTASAVIRSPTSRAVSPRPGVRESGRVIRSLVSSAAYDFSRLCENMLAGSRSAEASLGVAKKKVTADAYTGGVRTLTTNAAASASINETIGSHQCRLTTRR